MAEMNEPDELLSRVARGDRNAWEKWLGQPSGTTTFLDHLVNFARKCLRTDDGSEDTVHEAIIGVMRKTQLKPATIPNDKMRPYLFQAVAYRAASLQRKAGTKPVSLEPNMKPKGHVGGERTTPEDDRKRREDLVLANAMLGEVQTELDKDPKNRSKSKVQAWRWHYEGDETLRRTLTYTEIGGQLHINYETASRWVMEVEVLLYALRKQDE